MYYDTSLMFGSPYNKIINLADYGKIGFSYLGDLFLLWNSQSSQWRRINYAPRIVTFTSIGQYEDFKASDALYRLVYVYCEKQFQGLYMQSGSAVTTIHVEGSTNVSVERANSEYGDLRVKALTNAVLNLETRIIFIG